MRNTGFSFLLTNRTIDYFRNFLHFSREHIIINKREIGFDWLVYNVNVPDPERFRIK